MCIPLGECPGVSLLGPTVAACLVFFKKCQLFFPEWLHHVPRHQQCGSDLMSLHPHQNLVFPLVFFILAILMGVNQYLIVISICISLVANATTHLFTCLWSICTSSLMKCLFITFVHFQFGWFGLSQSKSL